MERFDIQTDQRLLARLVRAGTQGSAVRALLELVTNCDDSYRRLESAGHTVPGSIELLYAKNGFSGHFTVRDYAEGMSHDELISAFSMYGAATSGLKDGKSVTGFFGTGAKNALAGMTDGRICTFKDQAFCSLHIYLENHSLKGELEGPLPANEVLRQEHAIPENGTVAYFTADPEKGQTVPRFDTVHSTLANHWRLRMVMTNASRKIWLIDGSDKKKKRRLRFHLPKGETLIDQEFVVPCEHFGDIPVKMLVVRSEVALQQQGEDREGGLLITDDQNVALDMSLFKYDADPIAEHLFGRVVFGKFRDLLKQEEAVLDEKRDGLNKNHPVCATVIAAIEKRLEHVIQEEKRRQKSSKSKIDDDERARYRGAFKVLNEIAVAEAEPVQNLGQEPSDKIEPPPNGLCLYPDSAHVTLGKRYAIELRVDMNVFAPGSKVFVKESASKKIAIIGQTEFKLPKTKDPVCRRYVTIQGTNEGRTQLKAEIGKNVAEATIYVDPEKEENFLVWFFGTSSCYCFVTSHLRQICQLPNIG